MSTCMPSCDNITYMLGLLHEEAGELQGKFNKAIRKGQIVIDDNQLYIKSDQFTREGLVEFEQSIMKELGDTLWAVAGIAQVMGWKLDDVGELNLMKLSSRKDRGLIDGEGDNR